MRAIITGAARGIGRAAAIKIAEDTVASGETPCFVLVDRWDDEMQTLAEAIAAQGGRAVTVNADMALPDSPEKAVAACVEAFSGIDCIVSNAGAAIRFPLSEFSLEDWDRTYALNVRSHWLLAKAAFAEMKRSQGSVVITGSISGTNPQPNYGAYSSSKAAVIMLARQLAVEWGGDGIRVNVVSPGLTHTAVTHRRYKTPETRRLYEEMVPLKSIGQPEEIAAAIAFLASPSARYCTGANLIVDGGFSLGVMAQLPFVPVQ